MSASATETKVLDFPMSPRHRILTITRERPELAAVAVHLPPIDHPQRAACERVLSTLLHYRHAFHERDNLPVVPLRQARDWLDGQKAETITKQELPLIRDNPTYSSWYLLWRDQLWLNETDTYVREQAKLYVALYWHLYRQVMRVAYERLGSPATSQAAA